MPWLGGLADACCGKVIGRRMLQQGELPGAYCGKENYLEHIAARRTWTVLFRMGLECGV